MWITRESSGYELIEHQPDKQSIGVTEAPAPFTNHRIEIRKGDILYLFTDGFADQFGSATGKKLGRKKFKELLLLQRYRSLADQYNNLLKFHEDFKGNTEQIDDILVVGIKVER